MIHMIFMLHCVEFADSIAAFNSTLGWGNLLRHSSVDSIFNSNMKHDGFPSLIRVMSAVEREAVLISNYSTYCLSW